MLCWALHQLLTSDKKQNERENQENDKKEEHRNELGEKQNTTNDGSKENNCEGKSYKTKEPARENNTKSILKTFGKLNLENNSKFTLKQKIAQKRATRLGQDWSTQEQPEVEPTILYIPDQQQENPKEKLLVDATVAGIPVTFEVDTGSSITLISNDIFKSINKSGIEKITLTEQFRDFSGNTIKTIGLYQMPITMGTCHCIHPILVTEQEDGTCLLGIDIIRQKKLSIDNSGPKIVLKTIVGSQERVIPIKETNNICTTAETTTIEPGDITQIAVTIDRYVKRLTAKNAPEITNKIGIATQLKGLPENELLLPKYGLYQLNNRGHFSVPILNRTAGPIIIPENTEILEWTPLEPGTEIEDITTNKIEKVNTEGKVIFSLNEAVTELETKLRIKEIMPQIQTSNEQPTDKTYYKIIESTNTNQVDEKDFIDFNRIKETQTKKEIQAYLLNNTSKQWELTITEIYSHNQTGKNEGEIIIQTQDIDKCSKAYHQLTNTLQKKPPNLIIVTQKNRKYQENESGTETIQKVKKVKIFNDQEDTSEEDFSEDDLCEEFFYKKKILPSTEDTWKELLKDTPTHMKEEMFHLLTVKHKEVFSSDATDFGLCTLEGAEFRINLKSTETFSTRPYPLNAVYKEQIKETCKEMIAAGLLLEEASSYGSGVFIRPRPDPTGTGNARIRIIYDLRRLNDQTIKDSFPIPNIRSLLQNLVNKKMFILLDLKDSYQSIPIHPEDRHKAAIVTPDAVYTPTRMGYGFSNAPAHFSKTLAKAIAHIPMVSNYLDDIIIAGNNCRQLATTLDKVLTALGKAGFRCSLPKLNLFKKRLKILGFIISQNTISSDPVKTEAILKIPTPKTKGEIQKFLGAINYHSSFIQNFALIAMPLFAYTSSPTEKITLSDEAIKSFETLKQSITTPLSLNLIDPSRPIYLETDASQTGYGAVAYQVAIYDETSLPALKRQIQETQNTTHEELCEKLKGKIEKYIRDGQHPQKPEPIDIKEEDIESPYLKTPINTKKIGKLTYVIEVNFFLSKKFTTSQTRAWSSLMKELSAILITVEKTADLLLLASKVVILSDAKSAVYLYQQTSTNSIMSRYMARLSTYPFIIVVRYKKGLHIPTADALSRIWLLDPTSTEQRVSHMSGICVQVKFTPGKVLDPTEIIKEIEKKGNQIVLPSSDPNISKQTQTQRVNTTQIMKPPTQGNQNTTTRICQIRTKLIVQVRDLLNTEKYSKMQEQEFKEHFLEALTETEKFKIQSGFLLINKKGWRKLTPTKLRKLAILKVHLYGHYGPKKMYKILSKTEYWPKMQEDCEEFTKSCLSCLWIRPPNKLSQQLGIPIPRSPNEAWQIDVVSGLPNSSGHKFFLSAIDMFSKFLILIPLREDKAEPIAKLIETRIIAVFGPPKYITSDGATNMNKSNAFKSLAKTYNIKLKIRCAYSSRSLGTCERVHRSVLNCLRSLTDTFQTGWYNLVPLTNIIYNSIPHSATKFTPMELVFGRQPTIWENTEISPENNEDVDFHKGREHIEHIKEQAKIFQAEYSKNQNKRFGGKNYNFEPGMFCLALNKSPVSQNEKIKFRPKYTGPFLIHQVFDSTVAAESCKTGRITFIHKQFLRIIPEKDTQAYETLPLLAKIRLGRGHTYAEWQELLHKGELEQTLNRTNKGVDYGTEDLWEEGTNLSITSPDVTNPPPQNETTNSDSEEHSDSDNETTPTTNDHKRKVAFSLPEPRRSTREQKIPQKLNL